MAAIHFNAESFEQALGEKGLLLVDFWAAWCGPCRMLAPTIEELAEQYAGRVTVGKVDVDEAGELAQRYGVMSIPTVILFKDGAEAERKVGFMPVEEFTAVLDANL